MSDHPLHVLLERARAGDQASQERAYAELLRLVNIFVRAGMGGRLRDHRESIDVSQSIARSFVQDHREGDLRFDSDGAVVAYLKTVVRTKLALLARHDGALKRGGVSRNTGPVDANTASDAQPAEPAREDQQIRARDAARAVCGRLTSDDQEIARLRLAGLDWIQIGQQLGQDPQALRKRWSRLSSSLADDLGLS